MPPESAAALAARLGLLPHPEGGLYSRWYASPHSVTQLPPMYPPGSGSRPLATSILYMLRECDGGRSSLRRLRGDELWTHVSGDAVVISELLSSDGDGSKGPATGSGGGDCSSGGGGAGHALTAVRRTTLGRGHAPVHAVAGGTVFGAYLQPPPHDTGQRCGYALVSCVVLPGFDFEDWAMPTAAELRDTLGGGAATAALVAFLAKDGHGVAAAYEADAAAALAAGDGGAVG